MTVHSAPRPKAKSTWFSATLVALLCSFIALVGGTVLYVKQAGNTRERTAQQADLVVHLRELQAMLVNLTDAETGQRGYLLTGKERYLLPYLQARKALPDLLAALDRIPVAQAEVQPRIVKLRLLVDLKLSELAETIQLYEDGQHDAAMALVATDAGQNRMDLARAEIRGLLDIVRGERDRLGDDIAASEARSSRLLVCTVLLFVLFIALALAQLALSARARKRVQYALAQSEQHHRAIVEEQAELVSQSRADGTLVYVNPSYASYFGRQPQQMIGVSLYDFVEAKDRDAVRRHLTSVLSTGEVCASENRMVLPDGTERWVAWTNRRQEGPGCTLLHSVGRDITDAKRMQDALAASQLFLARTGRVAGVGGWEYDLRSGALYWSNEVSRIHEVVPGFVPTLENVLAFYPDEAKRTIEAAIQSSIEDGRSWDLELPMVSARGKPLFVRAVGEAEFEDGVAIRLAGAFQDITERKKLQQQLADSERFVRQVTDSVEIRIAYFDRDSRFRFVNLALCRRFGKERSEIIGRSRRELIGDTVDTVERAHRQAVLDGRRQHFEYDDMVNGEVRRIEVQLIPELGAEGQVQGFYTTGMDITDRTAAERALRELTAIVETTTDYVVQTDAAGTVQYLNASARRALGFTPDEALPAMSFQSFNTPETNQRFATEIMPTVKEHGSWSGEATVYVKDRRVLPVSHLVIGHRDAQGRIGRYSGVMRDKSLEVEARQRLLLQTATLQSVTEAIPAMVAVVGADEVYRFANSALERWMKRPKSELIGKTGLEVLGPDEYARSKPWVDKALAGESVSYEKFYEDRKPVVHIAVSYIPLRLASGEIDGFVAVAQDNTQQRLEAVRLLQLAERDALTGLLNRAGFDHYLQRATEAGDAASLALLYIDLDHFKPVNDRYGHPVGDQLLVQFGERLKSVVRPTDAVARLGGDEFAVVLSGVREQANVRQVADKVLQAAHTPFVVGAVGLSIGASVGMAFDASGPQGAKGLIERADSMLYKAKSAGRGQFA